MFRQSAMILKEDMDLTYSTAEMPCYLHTHTRTFTLQSDFTVAERRANLFPWQPWFPLLPPSIFLCHQLFQRRFFPSLWLTGIRSCGFSILILSGLTQQTNISLSVTKPAECPTRITLSSVWSLFIYMFTPISGHAAYNQALVFNLHSYT